MFLKALILIVSSLLRKNLNLKKHTIFYLQQQPENLIFRVVQKTGTKLMTP